VGKPPRKKIALTLTDWKGRSVYLDKDTFRDHIGRLHIDEALLTETLRSVFSAPIEVRENRNAKSENAIYKVDCCGKEYMVVAIKVRHFWDARVISTYYCSERSRLPQGRVIWKGK
jgi:hypothetical protein